MRLSWLLLHSPANSMNFAKIVGVLLLIAGAASLAMGSFLSLIHI